MTADSNNASDGTKDLSQATPHSDTKDNREIEEILETFAKWTINNVEHGIYIPLPSPETAQAIQTLISAHTSNLLDTLLEAMPKEIPFKDWSPNDINDNLEAQARYTRNQTIAEITTIIKEMQHGTNNPK